MELHIGQRKSAINRVIERKSIHDTKSTEEIKQPIQKDSILILEDIRRDKIEKLKKKENVNNDKKEE